MLKYSTLSHIISERTARGGGGCIRTHHRPYHNKWPSRVFVAGGWEEALRERGKRHNTVDPHSNPDIRPNSVYLQCQSAQWLKLFFFYFILCASTDGNKPKTNQFSSSASSWQSVAMDIQCGCMFTSKWRSVGVKGESKTHNSKQLLLLLLLPPPGGAPWSPWTYIFFTHVKRGQGAFFRLRNGLRKASEIRGRTDSLSHLLFLAISLIPIPLLRRPSNQNKIVISTGGSFAFLLTAVWCARYHVRSGLWQADKGEACITRGINGAGPYPYQ